MWQSSKSRLPLAMASIWLSIKLKLQSCWVHTCPTWVAKINWQVPEVKTRRRYCWWLLLSMEITLEKKKIHYWKTASFISIFSSLAKIHLGYVPFHLITWMECVHTLKRVLLNRSNEEYLMNKIVPKLLSGTYSLQFHYFACTRISPRLGFTLLYPGNYSFMLLHCITFEKLSGIIIFLIPRSRLVYCSCIRRALKSFRHKT